MSKPALIRLRLDFGTSSSYAETSSVHFVRSRALIFFVAPQMKRVGEHNVTHQAARIVVTEIDRWIELEIFCDVAGETDRRRVFGTALPIDLDPPPLVEVVGISKNCFVFVASMNGSGNQLVMLGIVASFDIRLRIDIQMRRPIHEPNRKEKR